ncbi:MAG: glycoside hydrolase family 97 N-terminal domain-containing protein [Bacteroidales bacterium]|nr:glycoside hydrolase family 97 N-terminal domain-containing protein [Bacteroidales bacterium]
MFDTKMIGCVTSDSLFSRKKDLTLQSITDSSLIHLTYLYIIIMKKILFFAWAFGLAVSSLNAQTVVSSPNGELKVEMNDKDGKATYRVLLGQDVVLEESPLGLVTSAANLSEGLKIGKVSDAKTVKESYELRNAKKQHISVEATEQTVNLTDKNGRDVLAVEWHVDNQNVAFRYIVKEHARRLSVLVTKEETGYRLPEGSTSFNCPQMGSQSGFARTAPSYESSYEWDAPLGKNGWGEGYVFPALFKVGTKAWVMLNETGLGANYCASHLQNAGGNLYQIAFPNPKEFGGVGTSEPGIALPAELPWRTITVGRTMKAMAETTIQAAALTGEITDPTTLFGAKPKISLPDSFYINDDHFQKPSNEGEIVRGPNIKPLPKFEPMPDSISADVVLKVGDNISTDHILPAGAKILPLRSNLPAISEHTFGAVDKDFVARAKSVKNGVIVGAENYGQGSSREHAALAPRYLGIKVVITKTFARIHLANLINFGIIPLTFADVNDYELIKLADKIEFKDIKNIIKENKDLVITVNGKNIKLNYSFTERQKEILFAGGLLNWIKEGIK